MKTAARGAREVYTQPVIISGSRVHYPSNGRLFREGRRSIPAARKVVFLDRDGVIVKDVHFATRPGQIDLVPGAANAIRRLSRDYLLIVATNQSGIARGMFGEATLAEIHTEMIRQLWVADAFVDAIYYCPHLPGADSDDYGLECACRKPRPGMLERAIDDWGLERAGSFNPCAVGEALEGFEFDGMGNGKTLYRAEDHQCFKDVLVVKGKENPTSEFDLLEIVEVTPVSQVTYDASIFGGELGACNPGA